MGGVGTCLISQRGGVKSTSHLPVVSSEPSQVPWKKIGALFSIPSANQTIDPTCPLSLCKLATPPLLALRNVFKSFIFWCLLYQYLCPYGFIYFLFWRERRCMYMANSSHLTRSPRPVNFAEEISPALVTGGKGRGSSTSGWWGRPTWGRTKFCFLTFFYLLGLPPFSQPHSGFGQRWYSRKAEKSLLTHTFLTWDPWTAWGAGSLWLECEWSWMGEIPHLCFQ